ncbi:MAG: mannose-1-phosphate guanylyltransferase/mannose-6-phosphate isomerase [Fretibacterium sp.]|nr:mannose-1-phosphate guanylyltransferase/mannose-6-phosphate isomerase [Fretibacterium sp.]
MSELYGLILTGGSGTRLWPRSREDLPKQFLALCGARTLFQETIVRMLRILPPERLRAVTGAQWESLVAHQAREVARTPEDFIVLEPTMRNTAPAILLGCEALRDSGAGEDDVVVVTPSDHIVRNPDAFSEALERAVEAARAGCLATLGIVPDRPDTGFGYIRRGAARGPWFEVEAFVEKPDATTAEEYLRGGAYLWNGGVFVFTLGSLYRELERTSPPLFSLAGRGAAALHGEFEGIEPISFDYAVMERARRVAVVPLDAGWSDVGSWDALHEVSDRDERNNAAIGDVTLRNASNCFVDSRNRLTVLNDVEDIVVVDSPDALFVTRRGASQGVRDVVRGLKAEGRREVSQISECARPWGAYRVLCEAERFKVKRMVVIPGKGLPLQSHCHRVEHWIVVRGTARVRVGDEERFVHEGEGVFVPKNVPCSLENCGRIELEVVAVQEGEYLGEDDSVRPDEERPPVRGEQ